MSHGRLLTSWLSAGVRPALPPPQPPGPKDWTSSWCVHAGGFGRLLARVCRRAPTGCLTTSSAPRSSITNSIDPRSATAAPGARPTSRRPSSCTTRSGMDGMWTGRRSKSPFTIGSGPSALACARTPGWPDKRGPVTNGESASTIIRGPRYAPARSSTPPARGARIARSQGTRRPRRQSHRLRPTALFLSPASGTARACRFEARPRPFHPALG